MTIERRTYARDAAPRAGEDGQIVGRAAPFNEWTMIGKEPWGFREKIRPGAFKKTLNEGDMVLLDNHNPAHPLARKSAGTLRAVEGERGLDFDADPVDTTYAHDAQENIRAGNYAGCSFGFEVVKEKWTRGEDGIEERELIEVKAPEISVVTFPAYAQTEAAMRSAVDTAYEVRSAFEDRGGDAPGNGSKPYGNVKYADPGYQKDGKARYPVDTKDHAKSAWAYINKAKNAGRYTAEQLAKIKGVIKSALKKFGIQTSDDGRSYFDPELRFEVREIPVEWAELAEGEDRDEFDADLPDEDPDTEEPEENAEPDNSTRSDEARMIALRALAFEPR